MQQPTDTPQLTGQAPAEHPAPMVQMAAALVLHAQHPQIAALPLVWKFSSEHGASLYVDAENGVAGVVETFAAAAGAPIEYGPPYMHNGRHRVALRVHVVSNGVEITLAEYVDAPPLPVRQKHTPAEQALCAGWIDEHGDPADWSAETRSAYAAALATMRAGGAL